MCLCVLHPLVQFVCRLFPVGRRFFPVGRSFFFVGRWLSKVQIRFGLLMSVGPTRISVGPTIIPVGQKSKRVFVLLMFLGLLTLDFCVFCVDN